jgi:hypothetical protein
MPCSSFENWRFVIGPVMLLIADMLGGNETGLLQACQFAIDSPSARMNVADDLRSVETALGISENQRQHTLLHIRKQRTRRLRFFFASTPFWVLHTPNWVRSIKCGKLRFFK